MADKKISELNAITGANTAADDLFVIVDTSATETKKISRTELAKATGAFTALQPGDNISELTNDSGFATQSYVTTQISNLVDGAPTALDTLNELAAALNDDADFASTITTQLGTKLDASDYTASDVLTKIKTVDGSGSGLDADLLDGNQATAFATSAQGSLADSALQPGDNISELTNNSNYVSSGANISVFNNDAGYLTSFTETNDLTAAVTWANVPDANITQSSVTQHQAALSITESQISDLGSYVVTTNNLSDLASASTARANLGLGTAATADSTDFDPAGTAVALAIALG